MCVKPSCTFRERLDCRIPCIESTVQILQYRSYSILTACLAYDLLAGAEWCRKTHTHTPKAATENRSRQRFSLPRSDKDSHRLRSVFKRFVDLPFRSDKDFGFVWVYFCKFALRFLRNALLGMLMLCVSTCELMNGTYEWYTVQSQNSVGPLIGESLLKILQPSYGLRFFWITNVFSLKVLWVKRRSYGVPGTWKFTEITVPTIMWVLLCDLPFTNLNFRP